MPDQDNTSDAPTPPITDRLLGFRAAPGRFDVIDGYVVIAVPGCTCGGPHESYGHRPGCGYDVVMTVAEFRALPDEYLGQLLRSGGLTPTQDASAVATARGWMIATDMPYPHWGVRWPDSAFVNPLTKQKARDQVTRHAEIGAVLVYRASEDTKWTEVKSDGHVDYVCPGGHEDGGMSCMFCAGGLSACAVCRAFEGAWPDECPGVPMTDEQSDAVYAGLLNYRAGAWHEGECCAIMRHCYDREAWMKETAEREIARLARAGEHATAALNRCPDGCTGCSRQPPLTCDHCVVVRTEIEYWKSVAT